MPVAIILTGTTPPCGRSSSSDGPGTADPPDRPAAPTVTAIDHQTLRAVGVDPADNNAPITSYDWRYRERGVGDPWQDLFNEVTLIQTITGLDASYRI